MTADTTDAPEGPLVIAVPSKGRLQENAHDFFARAGLELIQPRGARDYRGAIRGVPGVEIAYLSATEIARDLGRGHVHLGVTGEDVVRENVAKADSKVVMLDGLGFGHADVVVAVPEAWIDVATMDDLDEVASEFHTRNGSKLRVATKYFNLTREFFARHGVTDYRIVESLGATEGAPAAGTAEVIVDITTSGSTLEANALKRLDPPILKSEANLVASLTANWGPQTRETARQVFDRLVAQKRARAFREVRTRFVAADQRLVDEAAARFGVVAPFGGPTSSGMLTLHCPPDNLHALADYLRAQGATSVSVVTLDYVFAADNPLEDKLSARLGD